MSKKLSEKQIVDTVFEAKDKQELLKKISDSLNNLPDNCKFSLRLNGFVVIGVDVVSEN